MKEGLRKEYYRRVRLKLKSELTSTHRFEVINTLAVSVVSYSFDVIKLSEIKSLDTKTRKMLTMAKMHHPAAKADIDRPYLPRA